MKHGKTMIICIFLTALAWGMAAAGAETMTTLHILTDKTTPCWDASLSHGGLCGEIVHALSDAIGVTSVLTIVPEVQFPRYRSRIPNLGANPALPMYQAREWSAIVPIATLQGAVFFYAPHHAQGPRFRGWQDLAGMTVGIPRGWGEGAIKEALESMGMVVAESNSERSLFQKLLRNRLDACFVLESTGLYLLHTEFATIADNFVGFPVQGTDDAIALLLAKDLPKGAKLGQQLNAALDEFIASGAYLKILENYYGAGNIPQFWDVILQKHRQQWMSKE